MVHRWDDVDDALKAMKNAGAGAVVVHGSLATKSVAELAIKHGLPAATQTRSFTEVGGLMSYGADGPDIFRQSALVVTKLLQGANAANIPVEQPTRFDLAINLKTAKTLGVTVPPSFLSRADEVINEIHHARLKRLLGSEQARQVHIEAKCAYLKSPLKRQSVVRSASGP